MIGRSAMVLPRAAPAPGCWGSGAFTLAEIVVVVVVVGVLAALVVPLVDRTREDAEAVVARAAVHGVADALVGSVARPGYLSDLATVPGFHPAQVRVHDLLSPSSYPAHDRFDILAGRGWRGPYLLGAAGVANTNPSRSGAFPAAAERRTPDDPTFLDRGFFVDALTSPYGVTGDLAVADPWGNPIVLQTPPASAFTGAAPERKRGRYARVVSAGPDGFLSTPVDRLGGRLADGTAPTRGDDLVQFLHRADVYDAEEP